MTRLAIIAGAVLIWTVGAVAIGAYITHLRYQSSADYIKGTQDAQDATTDLPDNDSGNLGWLHEYINGR